MRRNLCRFSYSARTPTFPSSSATTFCTSAGGGGGGGSGRGRGSTLSSSIFTRNDDSIPGEPSPPPPPPPSMGHGRGRGQPLASSPIIPPFTSFFGNSASPGSGRGRGTGTGTGTMPPTVGRSEPNRKPVVGGSDDSPLSARIPSPPTASPNAQQMPSVIMSVIKGSGRGKPSISQSDIAAKPKQENRHIQPRQPQQDNESDPRRQRPVQDNSTRSLDDRGGGREGLGERYNRGRGFQGMGGRGGRGSGRGQGRGRDSGESRGQFDDADDDLDSGLYLGNDADGERLAKKLGPEKMNILAEAFEEVCGRVLPSPAEDAYVDALHTNLLIECEPEYLMEEFGTNPDIDEKPPIPLRDALEKMKPFLMAYEGIQSQEEWEVIIEDLMQRVPLIKEIVDYYSGPDRVTAKQQHQELERVATTLPASTPASLKRFANNAVLSLQSNPGWGFDKKCQLMDTLVREVSQNYK